MPTLSPEAFRASLAGDAPPAGLPAPLAALWWAHRDAWDKAHAIVQDDPSPDAAWVHAHLHRVEGDPSNAGFWYRRAGRPASEAPPPQEWEAMVAALFDV